ncbi:hypothetical protein F5Y16DRAFT_395030 [Xylariaceae sp. FL0255]|nr:hypothetical protein F5Y16DRAFT_395030 [Xylariaceae sp. FL0255]
MSKLLAVVNGTIYFIAGVFRLLVIDRIGRRRLLLSVFAVLCFMFPIVFCFYPETAGRTLEDMDEIFIRNPSWLVFGKKELTQRVRPQYLIDAEADRLGSDGSQITVVQI